MIALPRSTDVGKLGVGVKEFGVELSVWGLGLRRKFQSNRLAGTFLEAQPAP